VFTSIVILSVEPYSEIDHISRFVRDRCKRQPHVRNLSFYEVFLESETENSTFRFKSIAMHLWNGCVVLFITLKNLYQNFPLLVVFANAELSIRSTNSNAILSSTSLFKVE